MVLEGKADLQLNATKTPPRSTGSCRRRHSRHALTNDHGVDLHTEAASHVVRRTEQHAIEQLGVSCASNRAERARPWRPGSKVVRNRPGECWAPMQLGHTCLQRRNPAHRDRRPDERDADRLHRAWSALLS